MWWKVEKKMPEAGRFSTCHRWSRVGDPPRRLPSLEGPDGQDRPADAKKMPAQIRADGWRVREHDGFEKMGAEEQDG